MYTWQSLHVGQGTHACTLSSTQLVCEAAAIVLITRRTQNSRALADVRLLPRGMQRWQNSPFLDSLTSPSTLPHGVLCEHGQCITKFYAGFSLAEVMQEENPSKVKTACRCSNYMRAAFIQVHRFGVEVDPTADWTTSKVLATALTHTYFHYNFFCKAT